MNKNTLFNIIRGPLLVCCFVSLFLSSESGRAQDNNASPVAETATLTKEAVVEAAEQSRKALLKVVDKGQQKTVEIFREGDELIIQKNVNGEEEEIIVEADSIAGSIAFSVLEELAAEGVISDDGEAMLDLAELSGDGITIQVESDSNSESGSAGEVFIGILAVTLIFGGPIMVVGIVLYSRYRRRKLLHESMNKLIENGREIPDNLFNEIEGTTDHDQSLRKGMTSTGLGIALAISLSLIADPKVGSLGLIPLMIGLAHLFIWKINNNQKNTQA
ncbi:MAG: DUF6249 domain-containing protein [Cellvibrionaceae bacterium]